MTSSILNVQTHEEEVTTTVLPPIITTSYNSPLAYPIYSQEQCIPATTNSSAPPPNSTSRLEYLPFQRKRMRYETKQIVERVPIERTVVDYEEVKKINYVPREKVITDYYVVEHQTAYIPRNIEQKVIEYVAVKRHSERIEYKPVEKQIVHYPKDFDQVSFLTAGGSLSQPHFLSAVARSEGAPLSDVRTEARIQNVIKSDIVDRPHQIEYQKQVSNREIKDSLDEEMHQPQGEEEIPEKDRDSEREGKMQKNKRNDKEKIEPDNKKTVRSTNQHHTGIPINSNTLHNPSQSFLPQNAVSSKGFASPIDVNAFGSYSLGTPLYHQNHPYQGFFQHVISPPQTHFQYPIEGSYPSLTSFTGGLNSQGGQGFGNSGNSSRTLNSHQIGSLAPHNINNPPLIPEYAQHAIFAPAMNPTFSSGSVDINGPFVYPSKLLDHPQSSPRNPSARELIPSSYTMEKLHTKSDSQDEDREESEGEDSEDSAEVSNVSGDEHSEDDDQ